MQEIPEEYEESSLVSIAAEYEVESSKENLLKKFLRLQGLFLLMLFEMIVYYNYLFHDLLEKVRLLENIDIYQKSFATWSQE